MKFTVVRSSAGSGKTYTLVRKYLLLVLSKNDPGYYSRLLAITFTNKSTNEMKSRVVDALEGLSVKQPKYTTLLVDLSETLLLKEEEVVRRSENVLKELIHNYSDFSISTIDRFATRIIKSFAFELNIPGGFEIELDQQRILEKSIVLLFDKLITNKDLEQLFLNFAYHKFSSNKSYHLDEDLMKMAEELTKSESKQFVELLLNESEFNAKKIRQLIFAKTKQLESDVRGQAANLLRKIESFGVDESEIAGGSRGIYSYLKKTVEGGELKPLPAAGSKILESGNWKSSKVKADNAVFLDQQSSELTNDLNELNTLLESNWNVYTFCKIMTMRIDLMSIVYELAREIHNYKESNNLMQLEDFNERISSLINDSPVPYIYERTGEKYNHYLIDEFQDTSQIQWYNLIPLLEEGLSKGHESLIVGDEKQAIYRFRGGDVHQMGRLPSLQFDGLHEDLYKFRENIFKAEINEENLQFNFRSSKSVVEFVNEYFQILHNRFPSLIGELYDGHKQEVKKKEIEGSVKIKFLSPLTELDERLFLMKEEIDKYLSLGYNYGDLAILCRKASQCSAVANFLMQENYAVFSSESLKLSSSAEVNFLINWLRLPSSLDRRDVEFRILNYISHNQLFTGFDNDAFLELWLQKKGLQEILNDYVPKLDLSVLYSKSILDISTEITQLFLKENQLNPFVLCLIDQVIAFQDQYGNDLSEFVKWWDDKGIKLDVEMPVQSDSIQVMTIHKAKGLEFNVVLIPFMDEQISAGKKSIWVETKDDEKNIVPIAWLPMNKSLLETNYAPEYKEEMNKSFVDTLNVMYVAMTRAIHHISIFSTDQKKKDNEWREDNLLWHCFGMKNYEGSEEQGEFFMGVHQKFQIDKVLSPENPLEISEINNFNWRRNVELKFRSDDISLSDTAINAKEYGNLFHEIMSSITLIKDLPIVLSTLSQNSVLSDQELKMMQETIKNTLGNEMIKDFYVNNEYTVYNERDILSSRNEVLRPDRMMILNNKLILIDYKTGKPDRAHDEQISTYISVLNDLGDYLIEAYLIYFSSGEVKKVA